MMNSLKEKYVLQKKKNFLHKIDNTFLFFFKESEKSLFKLKQFLKDFEFIEIKNNNIYLRDFYYQNKSILGWNGELIFLGKINSNNKLEIIKKYRNCYNIISICLNSNLIFLDNSTKKQINEDKNEDSNIDSNEDSNIDSNNEDSDEDSNEDSNEDSDEDSNDDSNEDS